MASGHLAREKKTVQAMIRLYCRRAHGGTSLCPSCAGLSRYAGDRVDHCLFGEAKPACVKCPVHCYRNDMREEIRKVMRTTGPAMLLHHPYLASRHLLVSRFGKVPNLKNRPPGSESSNPRHLD